MNIEYKYMWGEINVEKIAIRNPQVKPVRVGWYLEHIICITVNKTVLIKLITF